MFCFPRIGDARGILWRHFLAVNKKVSALHTTTCHRVHIISWVFPLPCCICKYEVDVWGALFLHRFLINGSEKFSSYYFIRTWGLYFRVIFSAELKAYFLKCVHYSFFSQIVRWLSEVTLKLCVMKNKWCKEPWEKIMNHGLYKHFIII